MIGQAQRMNPEPAVSAERTSDFGLLIGAMLRLREDTNTWLLLAHSRPGGRYLLFYHDLAAAADPRR
jgi:hypothetical protein